MFETRLECHFLCASTSTTSARQSGHDSPPAVFWFASVMLTHLLGTGWFNRGMETAPCPRSGAEVRSRLAAAKGIREPTDHAPPMGPAEGPKSVGCDPNWRDS